MTAADQIRALADTVLPGECTCGAECHDLSPYPMPAIAQRIHERETYWCDQPKGHEGPHRWATSLEWTTPIPPGSDWGVS